MNSFDYARARENMVNGQLLTNGIVNPEVVSAYGETPRERFVDGALSYGVYRDEDVSIAPGQFVLEPLTEARMIQALEPKSGDSVLVIGACGLPAAAIFSRLARHVHVLEEDKVQFAWAKSCLEGENIGNVSLDTGTLAQLDDMYDIIFVPGAIAALTDDMTRLLAADGRLAAIIRKEVRGLGEICVYSNKTELSHPKMLGQAGTPYLRGYEPAARFAF